MDKPEDYPSSLCRMVTDNLDVAIYVADLRTSEVLYLSRWAEERWGRDYRQVRCTAYLNAVDKEVCPFCNTDLLVDADGNPTGAYRWEFQDPGTGEWFDCRDEAVVRGDGRLVHLEIAVDITDRKRSEQRMQASLREKDALLQEIHHRVKNNLQVVVGLLSMQAMHASNPETVEALQDSGRRIQLMARIHNRLYCAPDLANLRFDLLVPELADDVISSFGRRSDRVALRMDLPPIHLDIDRAIPFGQVISELISNSVKHAFPGERPGTIAIRMSQDADQTRLWIEDDGVGMPEDVDWNRSNRLGLEVVGALIRQLEGSIELSRGSGTRYRIAF